MAYVALYRTYRPKDFDSVVGQKHIVQTVKNQIKNDLLAHAYLFTGPRGTGKTSIARLVAKAVNCKNIKNGNPCKVCESCLAITNGSHPDVFELDGASNNGVDEIRDIRDKINYAPTLSAHKVYIIDEVHMLSTGAFNALLKTLEEPPAHVIFMLATTEIHKVPDTILSRTQRFDLKQIPSQEMADHFKRILCELDVPFEPGVPELVATLAAGGLRDGLSMLDQAIAYKTDVMKLADIHELNGSVDTDVLVEMMAYLLVGDFANVVASTRTLLAKGKLPSRVIAGLLGVLRDVLKKQKLGGVDETGLAEKMTAEQVLTFIKKLNQLGNELKLATDNELMLEIGLIELGFMTEDAVDYRHEIKALTAQVRKLEDEVNQLRQQGMQPSVMVPASKVKAPRSDALSRSQRLEPAFPVFVQGELVSGHVNEATDVELDLPVLDSDDQIVDSKGRRIENVLDHATKQDKSTLQNKVMAANAFAKLEMKEVIMLLKDADIAAATTDACLLVYDYETTVHRLLTVDNQLKARQVLTEMMGRSYDFLALPKTFWLAQREHYVMQKKQGQIPLLEQYPQQVDVKTNAVDHSTLAAPFYQEVVDLFGELVEVNE
ncbi:MAG: DNA polymerase III subunit gamma/tau [Defluviitaleaceae bacterium]|nr:DNA polymerase III subunit gamma/tau [Defluviitaleaceae bacterium]